MRVSSIILARGGSKGIPKKNLINFCGEPLLAWTILQSLAADNVSDTWVSSDSQEILDIATQYGAKSIKRPDEISGDNESSESAWLHAIDFIESQPDSVAIDYVLAPQVTSPLRDVSDFSNSINQLIAEKSDTLLSVAEIEDFFIWKKDENKNPESVNYDYKNRKLRQHIENRYLENGSFYIFSPEFLKDNINRLGGKISLYKMERYKMFQIDNMEDIELSSVIMKGYGLDKI